MYSISTTERYIIVKNASVFLFLLKIRYFFFSGANSNRKGSLVDNRNVISIDYSYDRHHLMEFYDKNISVLLFLLKIQ